MTTFAARLPGQSDKALPTMGKKAIVYLLNVILGAVTAAVAVLGVCGWLAGRTDPCGHGFIALMGLAMPAVLLLDFVLLIYWTVRKRLWAVLSLAVIVLNYGFIASSVQLRKTPEKQPYDIKLATYNVDGFRQGNFGATVEMIAYTLENEGVDVLCMQEFQASSKYDMEAIRKAFSFMPYVYAPTGREDRPTLVLFSRFPITDAGYVPFPKTDNSALWADLSVDGHCVRIVANHLQTTSVSQSRAEIEKIKQADPTYLEESAQAAKVLTGRLQDNFCRRAEQVAQVRGIVDTTSCPVVVCGDFNDTPASYVYHRMKERLTDGFRASGSGYGYTYRGFRKLLRIDYILYGPGLESVDYYSPSLGYSDHNPVMAELRFTPPAAGFRAAPRN